MDRLSPRLVEALNDQLELWARWLSDGLAPATSPFYALMVSKVHSASADGRAPIDNPAAENMEQVMATIKREAPDQYQVLKAEAWGLKGDPQLHDLKARARSLRIHKATYCRRLQRGRVFLTGLLFGPLILKQLERSA